MNNTNLNNQNNNNFSGKYADSSNQTVNNNVENVNFSSNPNNTNINNQNNLYNNQNNIAETSKKNNNVKLLAIMIVVIIIVIVIILIIFNNYSVFGSNNNTTGSTEYKGSDVDFNCTYEYTNGDLKIIVYSDFIFNYKTEAESGEENNYQLIRYDKVIVEYENGLTDDEYKDFVDALEATECFDYGNEDICTESHLELTVTSMGWDTVIDRIGNRIEMTYNNWYGMGRTATSEDIREVKEQYESDGYICK